MFISTWRGWLFASVDDRMLRLVHTQLCHTLATICGDRDRSAVCVALSDHDKASNFRVNWFSALANRKGKVFGSPLHHRYYRVRVLTRRFGPKHHEHLADGEEVPRLQSLFEARKKLFVIAFGT